ncbi:MAG: hypothetical protein ICV70_01485 [Jiangellaceae bacterium]|nr:hypothetical protein [Jiangellaceae bacterium]
MSTALTVLPASTSVDSSWVAQGLLGFLVFISLLAAVALLYLSLRKQLRRIDFDPEGKSDAERMRGRSAMDDDSR